MGLIVDNVKDEKNIISNRYIKINSIRAGIGSSYIDCECSVWIDVETRTSNKEPLYYNYVYNIPSVPIETSNSIIEGVYKIMKKYFEEQGYRVTDDTNKYIQNEMELLRKKIEEQLDVKNKN